MFLSHGLRSRRDLKMSGFFFIMSLSKIKILQLSAYMSKEALFIVFYATRKAELIKQETELILKYFYMSYIISESYIFTFRNNEEITTKDIIIGKTGQCWK